jgi:tetratricopeptide (TPR) repeat protein
MEMAQAVAGDAGLDEWAVLDQLSALVDKSLVVVDAGDAPRYRLLESARAFALEQLAAAEETATSLRRHAHAVRDFFERVDGDNLDGLLRTEQLDALLVPELDNLRAAHAWATGEGGDATVAVVLAACVSALDDFALEFAGWLLPLQPAVESGAVSPAGAARYWRAVASSNLVGHLPVALQLEAASRARALYQSLGQPRRAFSSVVQLARFHLAQHHDEAAQRATDEARALMQPDWPAMLRIRLLRTDGFLARRAGRFDEALPLFREAVRISASIGDWLLEVMARANLADLLWQIGPIEEAADEAGRLAGELRGRATAHADMALLYANLIGILSEMGRLDEAWAAARDGLPLMRRAQTYFVEQWAYLFWRRGRLDAAVRLLGASQHSRDHAGMPLQANEQRLIDRTRSGLERQLESETLTRGLAAGAAMGTRDLLALIDEMLEASDFH